MYATERLWQAERRLAVPAIEIPMCERVLQSELRLNLWLSEASCVVVQLSLGTYAYRIEEPTFQRVPTGVIYLGSVTTESRKYS